MSQHDYSIGNDIFTAVRSDLNNALTAILSQNSGTTFPTTTTAGMFCFRTDDGWMYQRNAADSGWVKKYKVSSAGLLPNDMSTVYADATGSANAYGVLLDPVPTSYVKGMLVIMKANFSNTSAATLSLNLMASKAITRMGGQPLLPGDIATNSMVTMVFDGTAFQIIGLSGQAAINGVTGGSANAFTLTPTVPITAYYAFMTLTVKANFTITGAPTLNVSGKGAKAILKKGTLPLEPGDIVSDQIFTVVYDGTAWQLQGVSSNSVFQKEFLSSGQTVTPAGALTIAHGLGAKPKIMHYLLVCLTAEFGYDIGDEVDLAVQFPPSNSNYGVSIVADATNINARFGAATFVFLLLHKTTGLAVNIHPANWAFVVGAFA